MIFHSFWFWGLLFLAGLLKILETIKSDRAFTLFILCLNAFALFMLAGSKGLLILVIISLLYFMLECLKLPSLAILSLSLLGAFYLKARLVLFPGGTQSYLLLSLLGLFYRRGGVKKTFMAPSRLKDMAMTTLCLNQYVGPVVEAEKLELKPLVYEEMRQGILYMSFGVFLFSLSPFFKMNTASLRFEFLLLPLLFFNTLNFMFLNFQGAVLVAIGGAKLLGVELPRNFARPYFATSLNDFWKRWHISLGRFFSDHFFLPLQFKLALYFNLRKKWQLNTLSFLALCLTWIFIGLWHEFSVKFLIWGLLNALFIYLPFKKLGLFKWPLTLLIVWLMQILFLSPDLFSYADFIAKILHIRNWGELSWRTLIQLTLSGAIFYFSQKMFDWKDGVQLFLSKNKLCYLFIVVSLIFLSLILIHRDQVVLYGQF